MSLWLILIMYDLRIAKQNWIPWPMFDFFAILSVDKKSEGK